MKYSFYNITLQMAQEHGFKLHKVVRLSVCVSVDYCSKIIHFPDGEICHPP